MQCLDNPMLEFPLHPMTKAIALRISGVFSMAKSCSIIKDNASGNHPKLTIITAYKIHRNIQIRYPASLYLPMTVQRIYYLPAPRRQKQKQKYILN